MSLHVDPSELHRAAARYEDSAHAAATVLDALPDTVQAGAATAALVGVLGRAAADVAGLVQTLGVTAGMLAACADAYRDSDADTAERIATAWPDRDE
ncbi:hypothetical protein [Rhodococcus sp. NPDC058639]|uniref:hypothetical protein n=1 Tax=Rhodococcus sp. NPDC058639 TaxID=3346570 RepID=UPI003646C7E4